MANSPSDLALEAEVRSAQLATRLASLHRERPFTLATAESCTGGLVGAIVTAVPGSSDYFLGGVISYANSAKVGLLGVSPATLKRYGAVSAATAREMAAGARDRLGAELAVSITGIAGPDGGTAAKPVGLVYVGLATPAGAQARRFAFAGDRRAVRAQAAAAALEWLAEVVAKGGRAARD